MSKTLYGNTYDFKMRSFLYLLKFKGEKQQQRSPPHLHWSRVLLATATKAKITRLMYSKEPWFQTHEGFQFINALSSNTELSSPHLEGVCPFSSEGCFRLTIIL